MDSIERAIAHCWNVCWEYILAFAVSLIMAVVSYFRAVNKGSFSPGWATFIARSIISLGGGLVGYLAAVVLGSDQPEARLLWAMGAALSADRILDLWEAIVIAKIEKLKSHITEDDK